MSVTANICVWSSEGSLSPVDVAERRGTWGTEAVDEELARLVEKRSRRGETTADARDESWKASVRAYNDRQREEIRAAWCEYHQGQAARHRVVLEALIARHEEQAAKLMDVQPEGAA